MGTEGISAMGSECKIRTLREGERRMASRGRSTGTLPGDPSRQQATGHGPTESDRHPRDRPKLGRVALRDKALEVREAGSDGNDSEGGHK